MTARCSRCPKENPILPLIRDEQIGRFSSQCVLRECDSDAQMWSSHLDQGAFSIHFLRVIEVGRDGQSLDVHENEISTYAI